MTRVEDIIEIESPASTVWAVLTDPSYLPKLYPDVITSEAIPPGKLALGSKVEVLARLGKVRVEVYVEVTRADPEVCFATRQSPGGLFKSFDQLVFLEGTGPGRRSRPSSSTPWSPSTPRRYPGGVPGQRGRGQPPLVHPEPQGDLRAPPSPQLTLGRMESAAAVVEPGNRHCNPVSSLRRHGVSGINMIGVYRFCGWLFLCRYAYISVCGSKESGHREDVYRKLLSEGQRGEFQRRDRPADIRKTAALDLRRGAHR